MRWVAGMRRPGLTPDGPPAGPLRGGARRCAVRLCRAAAVVLVLAVGSAHAATIQPALRARLGRAAAGERVPVIVVLSTGTVTAQSTSARIPSGYRAQLTRRLKQRFEATSRRPRQVLERAGIGDAVALWAVNSLALKAPRDVLERLAATPGVVELRLDRTVREPATPAAVAPVVEWNLARIRAEEVWRLGSTGRGVVIASLDSGVDLDHQRLAGRWRGGDNSWFDPSGEHPTPADRSGHGTQVMGLMVAGGGATGPIGVAPGARWIAAKIFDDGGQAWFSAIHQAFQWLLDPDGDPDTDDAPQVVNCSWGLAEQAGECIDEFRDDIALLKTAGIAVVFSAGNGGPGPATSVSPANNPGAFAVGASDENDVVSLFSSRGPAACGGGFPQLTAPAVAVRTTDRTFGGLFPDAFAYVTGTSFAAPQVAGGMALLLDAFPDASPEQLERALMLGAVDVASPGVDDDSGSGRLDILAAYRALADLVAGSRCADEDGDGFRSGKECGTPTDCDDHDQGVHPGAWDRPGDGIDQDCSGRDAWTAADPTLDGRGLSLRQLSRPNRD